MFSLDFVNYTYDPETIAGLTVQKRLAAKWLSLDPKASVAVVSSIEEALEYVRSLTKSKEDDGKPENEVQALITGSLHLVGGALSVLESATTL
jgi:hypothetical protein